MRKIECQISGVIIAVNAKAGDSVQVGDELLKVASMKMEIPVEAEEDGKLLEILVKEGDLVEEGQVIAYLDD